MVASDTYHVASLDSIKLVRRLRERSVNRLYTTVTCAGMYKRSSKRLPTASSATPGVCRLSFRLLDNERFIQMQHLEAFDTGTRPLLPNGRLMPW